MSRISPPDAEADIAAAHAWYQEQRDGLGTEFLEEVSAVIELVQSEPLRRPAVFPTLQRAFACRFPVGIWFLVRADTATIVAAMHLARHPRRIHRRAKPDLWQMLGADAFKAAHCPSMESDVKK